MSNIGDIVKKFLLSLVIVNILVLVTNLTSVNLEYAPSTILMYFFAGGITTYLSNILYDRLYMGVPSNDQLEIEVLQDIIKQELGKTDNELEQQRKALRKEYKDKRR